jgi:hypothetical protein
MGDWDDSVDEVARQERWHLQDTVEHWKTVAFCEGCGLLLLGITTIVFLILWITK